MSDGDTGSKKEKRGSFMSHAKETKQLMEEMGFDTVEQMRAALKGAPATATAAPEKATVEGYDPDTDPLSFVRDLDEVWLVSREWAWPAGMIKNLTTGKVTKRKQKAHRQRQWVNIPDQFKRMLRSSDPREDESRRFNNELWHIHVVTRELADEVYGNGVGPSLPDKAVVLPENFKGNDHLHRARGQKTKASGDTLTEYVRFCLHLNPNRTWIDTDRVEYTQNGWVDRQKPNPYGKTLAAYVMGEIPSMPIGYSR